MLTAYIAAVELLCCEYVGVASSDSEAADNGPARVLGEMEGLGSRSAPLPPLPQSLSPLCVELAKEVHVATLFEPFADGGSKRRVLHGEYMSKKN